MKHLSIVCFAFLLIAGCATKNEGTGPSENPQPLENKSFSRQWRAELSGGADNRVTAIYVTDPYIFAYRADGTSWVMARATGQLLHIDEPKESRQRLHPPVVLDDRIVYPTTVYLEVFDKTGRYIPHATQPTDELDKPFSQQVAYPIRSDAVGAGRYVFFGADFPVSGRFVGVDMTKPYVPELWTLMEFGASVPSTPALLKDIVYVASGDGKVAAVATDSREALWILPKGVFGTYGGVVASLAVDQTSLYVASTDTKLYSLQRTNGKVRWQYFAGVALETGPVVTKDLVYQYVPGTGMVAIDKNDASTPDKAQFNRNPVWVDSDATHFLSQDDTYAYLQTSSNQIVAVDKKSGRRRFTSHRNDLVAFGQNIKGDGVIYCATRQSHVIAVKPVLTPGQVGEMVLAPVPCEPLAVVR